MRREAKLLLEKASDSLVLGVEIFNRPHDIGRVTATLIHLDHSFEMLLKSAIVHRGGRIREKNAKETIGFNACVRRGLSDASVKFLTEEQALVLQTINGLRDAAQHYLLDISENQLYIHMQSGLTLFQDILKSVFGHDLSRSMPSRVLAVSTTVPLEFASLYAYEVDEIRKLLGPGKRRRIEAEARLRPLAIVDSALLGQTNQPSERELKNLGKRILEGEEWSAIFSGVWAVELASDAGGPSVSLRLTKKDGIPVHLVPEGTEDASVVAVKRVDELGFCSLGAKKLAEKIGITVPKLNALVDYLKIKEDPECYKEFKIGKSQFKQYSSNSITKISECIATEDVDVIWAKHRPVRKRMSRERRPRVR